MPYKCTYKRYLYKYKFFELGKNGAIPLNLTGKPRKVVSNDFYNIYKEWCALPNREDYRVEGEK